MIAGILARLSDTPKYERGMRAYDVRFDTANGEDRTVVLTRGNQQLGEQIRQTLFANHPEATDYTFREFDYPRFQFDAFVGQAIAAQQTALDLRLNTTGESFDHSEEYYFDTINTELAY